MCLVAIADCMMHPCSPTLFFCLWFLILRTTNAQNVAALRDGTGRIQQVNHDYFSRPILPDGTDGAWETVCPIDPVTGLLYDSHTSNIHNNSVNANSISSNTTTTTPDWCDLVQLFLEHAYDRSLSGASPSHHPLILAERSYNPPATRQMMVECLFEGLTVPAAFLAKDAVLSCYACGRTSATVVDLGYSGTTVTPVYEGTVEAHGVRCNPGASLLAVDETILSHLDKLYHKKKKQKNTYTVMPHYQASHKTHKLRKPSIHAAARLALARECREHGAGVTINTAVGAAGAAINATPSTFHAPSKPFELPDGTTIDVPSAERFRAADLLFGSDALSQQARDAKLANVQKELHERIAWIQSSASSTVAAAAATGSVDDQIGVTGGGSSNNINNNNASSSGDTENDKKQLAREAVGILASGRRNNNSGPKTKSRRRTAAAWQRATLPSLQTLTDVQMTASPLAAMVCDAVYRCDRDQQATLLGNVVLGGGGSCMGPTEQAVPDYVRESIEALIHQHTPGWRVKVLTPTVNERAILPWLGGSILGSLGTFHEMFITKAEYEEWGSAIVNRKCP